LQLLFLVSAFELWHIFVIWIHFKCVT